MANYNLIDSRHSNDFVEGTEGNDSINVYGNFTTIEAGAGNDIVSLNGGKHDGSIWLEGEEENIVNLGTGNDSITVYSRGASVFGDAGNDSFDIKRSYVYADGGADGDYFDVITLNDNFYNSFNNINNVTITGGAGKDTINVNPSQDSKTIGLTITDFSNEDILSINEYNSYYYYEKSRENHRVITQRVENGNVIISDNSSLTTSNGNAITSSVTPNFSITLQGVSDIQQVIDAQYRIYGYYIGYNPLVEHGTLGDLFGIEKTAVDVTPQETITPVEETETKTAPATEDKPVVEDEPVKTVGTETKTTPSSKLEIGDIFEMDGKYYKVIEGGYKLVGSDDYDDKSNGTTTINNTNNTTINVTNTNIDNSTNITNNTTVYNTEIVNNNNFTYTYVYNGGDKIINNYVEGELINLTDFAGINLDENNFYILSNSGSLQVQNVRGKFVDYSYGGGDPIAYSYLGNGGGVIDGRAKNGRLGVMAGGNYSDNQIYAGSGGSSLWGGMGGNDTLTGNIGYDEIFYVMGSGNDVIQNVDGNDVVNLLGVSLSQITYASIEDSKISADFADGGHLEIKSSAAVGFKVEGVTYAANRADKTWYVK